MVITELMQSANVTVSVRPEDLKEFALFLVGEIEANRAKEIQQQQKEKGYLTQRETEKRLNVKAATLWRWKNANYLVPVKVGKRNMYRLSDIERVENGGLNDKK